MKKLIGTLVMTAGFMLLAGPAQAESWGLSVGVGGPGGGFSFSYNAGSPVYVTPPPPARVAPVVVYAPRIVHHVPLVAHPRPAIRRGHLKVKTVRAPVTRVYGVPRHVVRPHQPVIVVGCR